MSNINNTSNQENYCIEEVDSDEETKKRSLCIEKSNKIVLNLNRSKRKLTNNSDGQLDHSSKRRSLNKSHDLDDSIYANLTELVNKYAAESKLEQHNKSSTTKRPVSKTLNLSSKKKSLENSIINGSPSLVSDKSSLISHSTPKVQSRTVRNDYDRIAENFSPFVKEKKHTDSTSLVLRSRSQNISTPESPILHKTTNSNRITKKSKVRTLFNSTNRDFQENRPVSLVSGSPHGSPVRPLSQTICTPESPVSVVKIKKPIISSLKTPSKNDKRTHPLKKDMIPIKSQIIISDVPSPQKGSTRVTESRCFLKLSKKLEKQIRSNILAEMNASKSNAQLKRSLVSELLNVIYRKREEHGNWLSLNKTENVQRSSLFLRLTKVRAAFNGFVYCDCEIDLDRTTDEFLFKFRNLKTVIPTHYANEFQISNQAVLEYISPWYAFENEKLRTTFIINPFWIKIIDHGSSIMPDDEDDYEVIYEDSNL